MHRKVSEETTLKIKKPWLLDRFKPDMTLWWSFLGSAAGVCTGVGLTHALGLLP